MPNLAAAGLYIQVYTSRVLGGWGSTWAAPLQEILRTAADFTALARQEIGTLLGDLLSRACAETPNIPRSRCSLNFAMFSPSLVQQRHVLLFVELAAKGDWRTGKKRGETPRRAGEIPDSHVGRRMQLCHEPLPTIKQVHHQFLQFFWLVSSVVCPSANFQALHRNFPSLNPKCR